MPFDNPDLVARSWFPYERSLIYLVKKYPVTYHPSPTKRFSKLDKAKWESAWIEIGTQLSQPTQTCKKLWLNIKNRYAKLVMLINTGKITKSAAMSHPETGRFFDGLLNFMDPFIISNIMDENIPFRIHKSINDIFGLKTKRTQFDSSQESYPQLVTHAQVKALLNQRLSNEEDNLDTTELQYLQIVVDAAVKHKLEELLQIKFHLSNPSNDTINTTVPMTPNKNIPMTPSNNLRNVRKRKPNIILVPSKDILNNDEENTTKTVHLGLETELIIDDDNFKMEDDDDIEEGNLTLVKNINNTNTTEENYDLENILPSTQIITPTVHDTMKNTSSLNNDVIDIEYEMNNIANAMVDDNELPISDDYIRNFFNELGVVLSLELSITKQNTLKSQINELLKDILLKEGV